MRINTFCKFFEKNKTLAIYEGFYDNIGFFIMPVK